MEQGKPRNPFINGALVVCDMLQTRLSAPKQRMLEVVRQLAGEDDPPMTCGWRVPNRSQCGHRLSDEVVRQLRERRDHVLQTYFHYCALRMSCVELARSFVYLANHGRDLSSEAISPLQARRSTP